MEELIRSLRLNQLANIPLTPELEKLNNTMTYIQDIFDALILKKDEKEYPNRDFYFVNDDCYFEVQTNKNIFWSKKEFIYHLKNFYYDSEIISLLSNMVENHFKTLMLIDISVFITPKLVTKHFNINLNEISNS